ncbi:MAG: hypothetical protein FJ387_22980 [Verrucomicrobia bacterium]|nr:hypothetical protein [Verrucomicrobiota bacterium]
MKAALSSLTVVVAVLSCAPARPWAAPPALPGSEPLAEPGDLAAEMVGGIDRYLERELAAGPARRWEATARVLEEIEAELGGQPEASRSGLRMERWLERSETNRVRLGHLLGVVDVREPVSMRFLAPVGTNASPDSVEVGRGPGYRIYAVVWNVFRGVEGEGLLVVPEGEPKADVIAVPDCDGTPEQALGLVAGVPVEQQFARRFATMGYRVLVPALIDRGERFAGNPGVRAVRHSQRETLWRASYEMGRTPLGYEVQKILAAADWLAATRTAGPRTNLMDWPGVLARVREPGRRRQELGVVGYGEGALLAFYAGALDRRFLAVGVCGAFGLGWRVAEQPIYRNVWSLLDGFSEAELAALIQPRGLVIEWGRYPEAVHTDEHGGAPGRLWRPALAEFEAEAKRFTDQWPGAGVEFVRRGPESVCDGSTTQRFCERLAGTVRGEPRLGAQPEAVGTLPDPVARVRRQYLQVLEDTQWLMRESEYTRREFWKQADRSTVAKFVASAESYRDLFYRQVVGVLPPASLPPRPRSRFLYETNGYRGYEVVLDVHRDVIAFGILLVPTDLRAGERRPVVVCQHGLEGRPRDVADPSVENPAYHRYACRLAERGFVTFSPQNPYIGRTRFRQVQRKAQPLGLTLWSFMVRQHEAITDWLARQPFVDPERMGFYGLSYGGKTAMRVPVLVGRYGLSICSADYNEWIWKNVSARAPYSYLWTSEYDMAEFNLGNTFNYAELSWLIFPRPFMVERGHDDGVAPDEWVAYEFAKTRRHYVKLGMGDRVEIEFFDGPHTIHGQGTFDFLHRHLRFGGPAREAGALDGSAGRVP